MSKKIAVFPLASPLLPDGRLPLRVFEARYLDLIRRHLKQEQEFAIALLASGSEVSQKGAKPAQAMPIATMAKVIDFQQGDDGCLHLLLQGESKVSLSDFKYQADGLLLAQSKVVNELAETEIDHHLKELLYDLAEQLLRHPALESLQLQLPLPVSQLAALLTQYLPFSAEEKYTLLELPGSNQRLSKIATLLNTLGGNPA